MVMDLTIDTPRNLKCKTTGLKPSDVWIYNSSVGIDMEIPMESYCGIVAAYLAGENISSGNWRFRTDDRFVWIEYDGQAKKTS